MTKKETSCGVIIYIYIEQEVHFLLVQSKQHGHFGFVKGHKENNESDEETAIREVKEEIGIDISLQDDFKAQSSYKLKDGVNKTVTYFIGNTKETTFTLQKDELIDYVILPYKKAYAQLNFYKDKQLLKLAHNYLNLGI